MYRTRPEYSSLKAAIACLFLTVLVIAAALLHSGCQTTATSIQNPPPPVRMVEEMK